MSLLSAEPVDSSTVRRILFALGISARRFYELYAVFIREPAQFISLGIEYHEINYSVILLKLTINCIIRR